MLDALDKGGIADNTLVIVTSDNGCSPQAKFDELLAKGHNPSYEFRGTKADIFDGGHRVPFLVRWPAHGEGRDEERSDRLPDRFLGDLRGRSLGAKLPDNAGEDSVSLLPALEGRADKPLREAVVHHSINGSFAIRQGKWKLELCSGFRRLERAPARNQGGTRTAAGATLRSEQRHRQKSGTCRPSIRKSSSA